VYLRLYQKCLYTRTLSRPIGQSERPGVGVWVQGGAQFQRQFKPACATFTSAADSDPITEECSSAQRPAALLSGKASSSVMGTPRHSLPSRPAALRVRRIIAGRK
jgi:hypothetical protein